MDREDVRCLILELTSVGNDLDKNDVADLYKACSILEDMSSARALDVVRSAGSRPALLTYMSDGWTTDVRSSDTSFLRHIRVTRKGRLRTEFGLERCVVKARVGR